MVTATVVRAGSGPGDMPVLGNARFTQASGLAGREGLGHQDSGAVGFARNPTAPARTRTETGGFVRTPSDSNISSYGVLSVPEVQCRFRSREGPVWVIPAPVKGAARMREKVAEYRAEGAPWPRAACILDPVRATVVCQGPAEMLEVAGWFLSGAGGAGRLPVCRVKNKFAHDKESLVRACRLVND